MNPKDGIWCGTTGDLTKAATTVAGCPLLHPTMLLSARVYCRFRVPHQNPPNRDETKGFVVGHKSLVKGAAMAEDKVWTDAGSGASHDLWLGRLPHDALWPSHTSDPKAGILPPMYTMKDDYC